MSGFQSPITIKQTIDRINRNEYLLPSFQREYVWSSEQVENLFDSLMKGYPISSMLFWKVRGESKNKYRFYQILSYYIEKYHIHNDAFDTNQINDFHAVLDGQQRLTSLYLGLCGSYAYHGYRKNWEYSEYSFPTRHLYLNISRTFPEDENDKTYNFLFIDKKISKEQDLYIDNVGDKWFKVSRILSLGNADSDYDTDDFADDHEISKEEKKMIKKLEKVIFQQNLINYYEEETEDPDKAVNIFVRINSGGTKLSFSDILMSIAVASWKEKDARTEIYQLVDSINSKGFNVTQDFILKAFLYLFHNDVRFRIKSFNNGFIEKIEKNWENIRNSILELFDLIRSYGLNSYTLTSNNTTLPILYYIYHRNIYTEFHKRVVYKDDREAIRKWLFKTLLLQTFGQSADRMLQLSRKAFTENVENNPFEEELSLFPSDKLIDNLEQVRELSDEMIDRLLLIQKNNRYAFTLMALLFPHMDYANNNFHLDHMHPAAAWKEEDHSWEIHNSIMNLQMLDANENMSKNDKPLKEWINIMMETNDKESFYKNHYIPNDVELGIENFNEFINKRKVLLSNQLKMIFSS